MPAAFPVRPRRDRVARPEDDAPLAADAAGSRQRPPGPADGNPLILRLSVSLLISAALLFWLLGSRQAAASWAAVRLPAPGVLGLLVLLQCLSYACRAARLSTQFATRLALGWRSTLRMTLLHNLGINVIPFRAGELLLPAMLHRAGLQLSEALATLLWLRVQDVVVLAGLGVVLWPGLPLALRGAALLGLAAAAARRALASERLDPAASAPTARRAVLATTLALTFLNPHVYLDTVLLLGALAAQHGDARWWFAAGAMAASALWFAALGFGAVRLRPLLARPGAWRVLDAAVALVMLVFAVRLLVGPL
jgi:L-lysine exporter family protein LysE/ArgO